MALLLDEATATTYLRAMTSAVNDPVLTDEDIERLLPLGQITDATGNLPGSSAYFPTYSYQSLTVSAVAGLREKLVRVMTEFDVGAGPGVAFNRSQKIAGIERAIAQYGGSVGTGGRIGSIEIVGVGTL